MTYEQVKLHLKKDCSESTVKCPKDDCDLTFLRKDLKKHVKEDCKSKQAVACPHCEEAMMFSEFENHLCNGIMELLYS